MFSRAMSRQIRYYSTPKEAIKLWVRQNGCPSTQVSIKGCYDLDDFAKKVKRKLNARCQVSLLTSSDKDYLDPGLAMKDLIKSDEFKNNSSQNPLIVHRLHIPTVSIVPKEIYIEHTDRYGEFTGRYLQCKLEDDEQLRALLGDDCGLVEISSPKNVWMHLSDLKDGGKYHFYRNGRDLSSWSSE